ncbi:HNH endonuclease [Micromonospora sp. NPDC047730]|uniref:HNH endonuclease n=1 Tax=Micromonospora sp. NPDC047730 TaxID=3364253 RepID=UPI003723FE24
MSGKWAGSTRRRRLPPNWQQLRAEVRERAGGRCEHVGDDGRRCPLAGRDCDHVEAGDLHTLDNLQWLCPGHHSSKSGREGAAARPRERRPVGKHPGLL